MIQRYLLILILCILIATCFMRGVFPLAMCIVMPAFQATQTCNCARVHLLQTALWGGLSLALYVIMILLNRIKALD
jgi:hypothetical protein